MRPVMGAVASFQTSLIQTMKNPAERRKKRGVDDGWF
jgi:hypothetical protein